MLGDTKQTKARRLQRPAEYFRRGAHPWHTMAAFRYHLDRRHRNGLVACGAVVETPIGLLIDPPVMAAYLTGEIPTEERAA